MNVKHLLFFALIVTASFANAQSLNKTEPQQFWDTNIQAILDEDVDAVVEQAYFPMSTFEGDWSKRDFKNSFDVIFDRSVLEALGKQTYRDIQATNGTDGLTYKVVVMTYTEIDGELYESATMLYFQKFDDEWKLFKIDMAG